MILYRSTAWAVLALAFLAAGPALAAPEVPPAGPPAPPAEEPLPAGATARLGSPLFRTGDLNGVYSAALTPDGKFLAVTGGTNILRFLDLATGRFTRSVRTQDAGMQQMHFVGGKSDRLLTANYNGVRLWDVSNDTAQLVRDFSAANRRGETPAALSADGARVAICGPRYQPAVPVVVHDVAKGDTIATVTAAQNQDVRAALSADGSLLATWGRQDARNDEERKKNLSGVVQVWDVATAKEKFQIQTESMAVAQVAFSPDGKLLATSSGTGPVRVWNAADGKSVAYLAGRRGQGAFLTFSPDSTELAAATPEGLVQRFEATTGKRLSMADAPGGRFVGLAYTARDRLVAWSLDGPAIHAVEAISGKRLSPDGGHRYPVTSLCFLADGKGLLSASNEGRVIRWDLATSRPTTSYLLRSDNEPVYSPGYIRLRNGLAFSADARFLTYAGDSNTIHLCEADTGREICVFENQNSFDTRLSLSPDGSALAAGGQNTGGAVTLWNVETGQPIHKAKLPAGQITGMACSAGGSRLAVGSYTNSPQGGTVSEFRLIDPADGRELVKEQSPYYGPLSLAFSRDGRRLAVQTQQGTVTLRDARSGEQTHRFPAVVQNLTAPMAFSPDGRLLATASTIYDGTGPKGVLAVWEAASGTVRHEFRNLPGTVSAMAFSPDGLTLAAGGADTTILLLDISGGVGPGRSVALKPSPAAELWERLGTTAARDAETARVQLILQPEDAVSLIRKEVRPVPRKEATAERIVAWLNDLDSRKFQERERAQRELLALGRLALPAVVEALGKEPSPEKRRRLQELRARADRPEDVVAQVRPLRAIEVLERIGTAPARETLKELADGAPGALLTEEARSSLARLGK